MKQLDDAIFSAYWRLREFFADPTDQRAARASRALDRAARLAEELLRRRESVGARLVRSLEPPLDARRLQERKREDEKRMSATLRALELAMDLIPWQSSTPGWAALSPAQPEPVALAWGDELDELSEELALCELEAEQVLVVRATPAALAALETPEVVPGGVDISLRRLPDGKLLLALRGDDVAADAAYVRPDEAAKDAGIGRAVAATSS